MNLLYVAADWVQAADSFSEKCRFRKKAKALPEHSTRSAQRGPSLMPGLIAVGLWLTLLAPFSAAKAQPAASTSDAAKARVLLVTGIDYPGHHWRETAPVLAAALRKDPRLEVTTVEDPGFLDSSAVATYDVILLHFQNWQCAGPGQHARENLRKLIEGGKGLVLVHFACGAWHEEWPEFANLAGRVWAGPNVRQHDPFGPFRVEIAAPDNPIVHGLAAFETHDELYTCLTGDHPIEILARAKSKVDGKYYPMAFTSHYGKGRTFHCVLGHDAGALSVPTVQDLYRRGCAWAAGLSPTPGD